MARDPYIELGIARDAGQDDVRRAFHKLAKAYHPDTNPGDKAAEDRFKQVSAAFDIIGDPEKRRRYDRGEIDNDGRETAFSGFGGGPFEAGGARQADFEGFDLNDILSEMFQPRGGAAGPGRAGMGGFQSKGRDVRARLEIDLEDTISGAKRRISFSDGRTVEVSIPQGATDGRVLRLKGQGAPGRSGAPGDALIELSIKAHPVFRRGGDLLIMDLPVTIPDAVLGGKVKAPTPDGMVTLSIPKNSNAGQTLRLKAKGVYDDSGNRGDLLARLVLVLPSATDPLLEAFCHDWRRDRPYVAKAK